MGLGTDLGNIVGSIVVGIGLGVGLVNYNMINQDINSDTFEIHSQRDGILGRVEFTRISEEDKCWNQKLVYFDWPWNNFYGKLKSAVDRDCDGKIDYILLNAPRRTIYSSEIEYRKNKDLFDEADKRLQKFIREPHIGSRNLFD